MPFFQDARDTKADNSHFNDVTGNQYLTDDRRQYAGDDRPTHTNVTHGDAFHGTVQGGNVGGRGNHYGSIPKAATAPPTTQQRFNPSASAAVDEDDSELLEAQLTLTRVQLTARREKQRADRLGAELTDAQARLAAAESNLAAVQRELAKYKPGGF